jgi:hypothetical protein
MMRFTVCKLGLAVAVAAFASGAHAQAATHSNAKGTADMAAQGTTAPKTQSTMKKSTTTKSPMAHRDKATHRASTSRGHRGNTMESNASDSGYRAALRRCVTGPESQRDSCLDDAITRYAHA